MDCSHFCVDEAAVRFVNGRCLLDGIVLSDKFVFCKQGIKYLIKNRTQAIT